MSNVDTYISLGTRVEMSAISALEKRIRDLQSKQIRFGTDSVNLQRVNRDLSLQYKNLQNISGINPFRRQTADVAGLNRNLRQTNNLVEEYGRVMGLASRRFAAYSMGAGAIMAVNRSLREGVSEAIKFDDIMVRIGQVLDKTRAGVKGMTDDISRLSVELGVSATKLADTALILAQAGYSALETKTAMEAVARASLSPSFTDMNNTIEGVIATIQQFKIGANDIEASLGAINAVSKAFAVEANDIISAIRRTGSVFSEVSNAIDTGQERIAKFMAMFTSMRATTRETAETIATGMRTIITRVQRADSLDTFRKLGIDLQDVQGKFIGPYEAINKISEALINLDKRDVRFSAIVEDLGGFRQVSKVIPLLTQIQMRQEAYNVALEGTNSLSSDSEKRMESYAVKLAQVGQNFNRLIRNISDDTGFRRIADGVLKMSNAFIDAVDNIRPLLPIIGLLGGIKLVGSLGSAVSGAIQGFSGTRNLEPKVMSDAFSTSLRGTNDILKSISNNTKLSKDYISALSRSEVTRMVEGGPSTSPDSALLKHLSFQYRGDNGISSQVSGLVTRVVQAGERLSSGGRARSQTYEVFNSGTGRVQNIQTDRIVHGTDIIHNDLQVIKNLIANYYKVYPTRPIGPTQRVDGGFVPQYHSFGNYIHSGVVGSPSGAASRDAIGHIRGTDTYAATIPSGSFVLNRSASKRFGEKYGYSTGGISHLNRGGVPAMLTPGEIVLSPQEVRRFGLARINADNNWGRQNKTGYFSKGGTVYPFYNEIGSLDGKPFDFKDGQDYKIVYGSGQSPGRERVIRNISILRNGNIGTTDDSLHEPGRWSTFIPSNITMIDGLSFSMKKTKTASQATLDAEEIARNALRNKISSKLKEENKDYSASVVEKIVDKISQEQKSSWQDRTQEWTKTASPESLVDNTFGTRLNIDPIFAVDNNRVVSKKIRDYRNRQRKIAERFLPIREITTTEIDTPDSFQLDFSNVTTEQELRRNALNTISDNSNNYRFFITKDTWGKQQYLSRSALNRFIETADISQIPTVISPLPLAKIASDKNLTKQFFGGDFQHLGRMPYEVDNIKGILSSPMGAIGTSGYGRNTANIENISDALRDARQLLSTRNIQQAGTSTDIFEKGIRFIIDKHLDNVNTAISVQNSGNVTSDQKKMLEVYQKSLPLEMWKERLERTKRSKGYRLAYDMLGEDNIVAKDLMQQMFQSLAVAQVGSELDTKNDQRNLQSILQNGSPKTITDAINFINSTMSPAGRRAIERSHGTVNSTGGITRLNTKELGNDVGLNQNIVNLGDVGKVVSRQGDYGQDYSLFLTQLSKEEQEKALRFNTLVELQAKEIDNGNIYTKYDIEIKSLEEYFKRSKILERAQQQYGAVKSIANVQDEILQQRGISDNFLNIPFEQVGQNINDIWKDAQAPLTDRVTSAIQRQRVLMDESYGLLNNNRTLPDSIKSDLFNIGQLLNTTQQDNPEVYGKAYEAAYNSPSASNQDLLSNTFTQRAPGTKRSERRRRDRFAQSRLGMNLTNDISTLASKFAILAKKRTQAGVKIQNQSGKWIVNPKWDEDYKFITSTILDGLYSIDTTRRSGLEGISAFANIEDVENRRNALQAQIDPLREKYKELLQKGNEKYRLGDILKELNPLESALGQLDSLGAAGGRNTIYDPADHFLQVYYASLTSAARGMGADLYNTSYSLDNSQKGLLNLVDVFKNIDPQIEQNDIFANVSKHKIKGRNVIGLYQNYFNGVKEAIERLLADTGDSEKLVRAAELEDYYNANWINLEGMKFESSPFTAMPRLVDKKRELGVLGGKYIYGKTTYEPTRDQIKNFARLGTRYNQDANLSKQILTNILENEPLYSLDQKTMYELLDSGIINQNSIRSFFSNITEGLGNASGIYVGKGFDEAGKPVAIRKSITELIPQEFIDKYIGTDATYTYSDGIKAELMEAAGYLSQLRIPEKDLRNLVQEFSIATRPTEFIHERESRATKPIGTRETGYKIPTSPTGLKSVQLWDSWDFGILSQLAEGKVSDKPIRLGKEEYRKQILKAEGLTTSEPVKQALVKAIGKRPPFKNVDALEMWMSRAAQTDPDWYLNRWLKWYNAGNDYNENYEEQYLSQRNNWVREVLQYAKEHEGELPHPNIRLDDIGRDARVPENLYKLYPISSNPRLMKVEDLTGNKYDGKSERASTFDTWSFPILESLAAAYGGIERDDYKYTEGRREGNYNNEKYYHAVIDYINKNRNLLLDIPMDTSIATLKQDFDISTGEDFLAFGPNYPVYKQEKRYGIKESDRIEGIAEITQNRRAFSFGDVFAENPFKREFGALDIVPEIEGLQVPEQIYQKVQKTQYQIAQDILPSPFNERLQEFILRLQRSVEEGNTPQEMYEQMLEDYSRNIVQKYASGDILLTVPSNQLIPRDARYKDIHEILKGINKEYYAIDDAKIKDIEQKYPDIFANLMQYQNEIGTFAQGGNTDIIKWAKTYSGIDIRRRLLEKLIEERRIREQEIERISNTQIEIPRDIPQVIPTQTPSPIPVNNVQQAVQESQAIPEPVVEQVQTPTPGIPDPVQPQPQRRISGGWQWMRDRIAIAEEQSIPRKLEMLKSYQRRWNDNLLNSDTQTKRWLGISNINISPGSPMRYQRGGLLPGYGGGDRRLALLEDGEYVINKDSTRRYKNTLDSINSGIPGFSDGGMVHLAVGGTTPEQMGINQVQDIFTQLGIIVTGLGSSFDELSTSLSNLLSESIQLIAQSTKETGALSTQTREITAQTRGIISETINAINRYNADPLVSSGISPRMEMTNGLTDAYKAVIQSEMSRTIAGGGTYDLNRRTQELLDDINIQLPATQQIQNRESLLSVDEAGGMKVEALTSAIDALNKKIESDILAGRVNTLDASRTQRDRLISQREVLSDRLAEGGRLRNFNATSIYNRERLADGTDGYSFTNIETGRRDVYNQYGQITREGVQQSRNERIYSLSRGNIDNIITEIEDSNKELAQLESTGDTSQITQDRINELKDSIELHNEALKRVEEGLYRNIENITSEVDAWDQRLQGIDDELARARSQGDQSRVNTLLRQRSAAQGRRATTQEERTAAVNRYNEQVGNFVLLPNAGQETIGNIVSQRQKTFGDINAAPIGTYNRLLEEINSLNGTGSRADQERINALTTQARQVFATLPNRENNSESAIQSWVNSRIEQFDKEWIKVLSTTNEMGIGEINLANRFQAGRNTRNSQLGERELLNIMGDLGVDQVAQRQYLEEYRNQIKESQSRIHDSVIGDLQYIEESLANIEIALASATGEDREKLQAQQRELLNQSEELQRAQGNLDNFGQVLSGQRSSRIRNIGERVGQFVNNTSTMMMFGGGMMTQMLGGDTALGNLAGGVLTTGSVYGNLASQLNNPYLTLGAVIGGGLYGGYNAQRERSNQKNAEDAQRQLTESTKQLNKVFNSFVQSGDIDRLQQAFRDTYDTASRSGRVSLNTGLRFGQADGLNSSEAIRRRIEQGDTMTNAQTGLGAAGFTAFAATRLLPLLGLGGPAGWAIGGALTLGAGALGYGISSSSLSGSVERRRRIEMERFADEQTERFQPGADVFQQFALNRLQTNQGETLNNLLADRDNIEGIKQYALAFGNLQDRIKLNELALEDEARMAQLAIRVTRDKLSADAANIEMLNKMKTATQTATRELENYYDQMSYVSARATRSTTIGGRLEERQSMRNAIYGGSGGVISFLSSTNPIENMRGYSRDEIARVASIVSIVGGGNQQSSDIANILVAAKDIQQQLPGLVLELAQNNQIDNVDSFAVAFERQLEERFANVPRDIISFLSTSVRANLAEGTAGRSGGRMSANQLAEGSRITDLMQQASDRMIKPANDLFNSYQSIIQKFIQSLNQVVGENIAAAQKIADATAQRFNIEQQYRDGLRQFTGLQTSVNEAMRGFNGRILSLTTSAGLGTTDVTSIIGARNSYQTQLQAIQDLKLEIDPADIAGIEELSAREVILASRMGTLQTAIEALSNDTTGLSAIQSKIADIESRRQQVEATLEDWAGLTQSEQFRLSRDSQNAARIQATGGRFATQLTPDQYRSATAFDKRMQELLLSLGTITQSDARGLQQNRNAGALLRLQDRGMFGRDSLTLFARTILNTRPDQDLIERAGELQSQQLEANAELLRQGNDQRDGIGTRLDEILQILRAQTGVLGGEQPQRFASGGTVPGMGNRDTVKALLTPNEFVVNATAARKYRKTLENMNNGTLYAADGMMVPNGINSFNDKRSRFIKDVLENKDFRKLNLQDNDIIQLIQNDPVLRGRLETLIIDNIGNIPVRQVQLFNGIVGRTQRDYLSLPLQEGGRWLNRAVFPTDTDIRLAEEYYNSHENKRLAGIGISGVIQSPSGNIAQGIARNIARAKAFRMMFTGNDISSATGISRFEFPLSGEMRRYNESIWGQSIPDNDLYEISNFNQYVGKMTDMWNSISNTTERDSTEALMRIIASQGYDRFAKVMANHHIEEMDFSSPGAINRAKQSLQKALSLRPDNAFGIIEQVDKLLPRNNIDNLRKELFSNIDQNILSNADIYLRDSKGNLDQTGTFERTLSLQNILKDIDNIGTAGENIRSAQFEISTDGTGHKMLYGRLLDIQRAVRNNPNMVLLEQARNIYESQGFDLAIHETESLRQLNQELSRVFGYDAQFMKNIDGSNMKQDLQDYLQLFHNYRNRTGRESINYGLLLYKTYKDYQKSNDFNVNGISDRDVDLLHRLDLGFAANGGSIWQGVSNDKIMSLPEINLNEISKDSLGVGNAFEYFKVLLEQSPEFLSNLENVLSSPRAMVDDNFAFQAMKKFENAKIVVDRIKERVEKSPDWWWNKYSSVIGNEKYQTLSKIIDMGIRGSRINNELLNLGLDEKASSYMDINGNRFPEEFLGESGLNTLLNSQGIEKSTFFKYVNKYSNDIEKLGKLVEFGKGMRWENDPAFATIMSDYGVMLGGLPSIASNIAFRDFTGQGRYASADNIYGRLDNVSIDGDYLNFRGVGSINALDRIDVAKDRLAAVRALDRALVGYSNTTVNPVELIKSQIERNPRSKKGSESQEQYNRYLDGFNAGKNRFAEMAANLIGLGNETISTEELQNFVERMLDRRLLSDVRYQGRRSSDFQDYVRRIRPQSFATGGIVIPRGNPDPSYFIPRGTDTQPAMLTPGEFVVNATATKRHLPLLEKINKGIQYRQTGGIIGQTTPFAATLDSTTFADAVSHFRTITYDFSTNFGNAASDIMRASEMLGRLHIPDTINFEARHDININLNGATVLSNIMPTIKDMVINNIQEQLNIRFSKNTQTSISQY